jgi:acyl carrier protein phosphodiesterase
MVGNFIADAVKGKQIDAFDDNIRKGIKLHRAIDSFTDSHAITKQSRQRLQKVYRHYSGVIVDIYYDHFLAVNWSTYHDSDLKEFTIGVYDTLNEYADVLPGKIKFMLQYMVPQNWLLNYAHFEGIERVLTGMSNRTKFNSGMEHAIYELKEHYPLFEEEFSTFFPFLQQYVAATMQDWQ